MIAKHQRGHRFYNWHCPGKNAWIMASARSEAGLVVRTGDRFLFVGDCSCWLERDTKINLLQLTDAALHATGTVGFSPSLPARTLACMRVLAALHPVRRK